MKEGIAESLARIDKMIARQDRIDALRQEKTDLISQNYSINQIVLLFIFMESKELMEAIASKSSYYGT